MRLGRPKTRRRKPLGHPKSDSPISPENAPEIPDLRIGPKSGDLSPELLSNSGPRRSARLVNFRAPFAPGDARSGRPKTRRRKLLGPPAVNSRRGPDFRGRARGSANDARANNGKTGKMRVIDNYGNNGKTRKMSKGDHTANNGKTRKMRTNLKDGELYSSELRRNEL